MDIDSFMQLFSKYGLILIFVVNYLEHLNCPGFPAGVIMPATGFLAWQSNLNILWVIFISVVAGLLGSLTLYGIFYFGGHRVLNKIANRNEKFRKFVDRCTVTLEEKGALGMFLCRLTPVVRTIVSFPAGVFRMDVYQFTVMSAAGIAVWNSVTILFGYFFGVGFINA